MAVLATARRRAVFAAWRLRTRYRRPRRPPRAQECLDRLTRLAGVLANAGFISEQVRTDVVRDMTVALAARSLIDQADLVAYSWETPSPAWGTPSAAPIAGRLRAVPVGLSTEYHVNGSRIGVYLGTLIVGATTTRLTVTAKVLSAATRPETDDDEQVLDLDGCRAIDDVGGSYRAGFSGGGGERWDGTFEFNRSPAAGVRWLEVSVRDSAPVRIDMTASIPALPTTSVPLPDGAADRFLDSLTLDALVRRRTMESESPDEEELVAAASDLLDAGLITPGSPATGRLAAAAKLLDLKLPARLAELGTARLPDDWLVMLSQLDRQDGPVGAIPLAAQLPDLEGMQCLITGIESDHESVTVQVTARGWPEQIYAGMVTPKWWRWTARDDSGCLYVADEIQAGHDEEGADITLQLRPAIRPQARTLTINLTGRTGQVGVTLPLNWQEGP
jgi:hypothetical protein